MIPGVARVRGLLASSPCATCLRPFTQHGGFCCCTSLMSLQLHSLPHPQKTAVQEEQLEGFSCSCLCSSSEVFAVPVMCSPVYGNDTSCGLLSVYQIVPFRIYIYWCSSVQNSWEALSGNLYGSEQRSPRDRMPPGGDLAVTR